ncbi:MAG: zinc ribbon domain-containing protein [Clostridia bacterium]|nr:zinc ribbon domain-containing protein [Clostridia bacterium]
MKLFKRFFERKYPKNKIETENDPIDVYAGPEPDEPGEPVAAERPDPERIRKPVFGHVYAGPGRMRKNKRQVFEAVYAGPDQMDGRPERPIKLVYAAPEKTGNDDDVKPLVMCGQCGEDNDIDAEVCKKCGAKLK